MNQACDIERSPWSEGTGCNSDGLHELTNVYRPANATLKGTAAGGATVGGIIVLSGGTAKPVLIGGAVTL